MHELDVGASKPLVPPIFQSSVYSIPDLDAIDRIYEGKDPGFIYARDDHPNAKLLADELNHWESGQWTVVCGSGMSALSAAILAVVRQGDRIVASDRLYGRTNQLLGQELSRFGVQTTFVDTNDLEQTRRALETGAKLLVVESLSNPLLRVADLPALVKLCSEGQCRLLVDNTFATPVLLRPLELGADLVVESLTKMMAGHGDITLGSVSGRNDLAQPITQVMRIWGFMSNPFECWLALHGLATLSLRMETACANAGAIADRLAEQSAVQRVVYPRRTDHPDHALAKSLLGERFGNMLCFELAGGRTAVNRLMRQAKRIPFSPSLGHTETTCSHPASTSHRFFPAEERQRQGITDGLVRLSVGVEPLEKILAELSKGLN